MQDLKPALAKDALVAALRDALAAPPWIHAAWLGGSAAFGRADAWSDVDVQAIVDDGQVEAAFAVAEAALAALSPIEHRLIIPMPTWHGHAQRFYRLRDAGEFLLVDLVVMERSHPARFLEPERHGQPVVLFDKAGLVVPAPVDRDAWRARLRRRVEQVVAAFEMFQCLPKKDLARGNALEALATYHNHTLRPLVELLRIRHDPFRHDFHVRYLKHDLPADAVARLERLYFVAGPAEIGPKRDEAEVWFKEVLAALRADAG